MPELEPRITFSFESHISEDDQALISSYIGRLGLVGNFVHPNTDTESFQGSEVSNVINHKDQIELIRENGYRFCDIKDTNDVLFREHFKDFSQQISSFNPGVVSRAFHALIDSGIETRLFEFTTAGKQQYREPNPLPGIVLIRRTESGFPESKIFKNLDTDHKILACGYGMTAGSIMNAIDTNLSFTYNSHTITSGALLELRIELSRQLGTN